MGVDLVTSWPHGNWPGGNRPRDIRQFRVLSPTNLQAPTIIIMPKRVATNLLSFLQHQKTGPFTFYRAFQLPEVGSRVLETSSPNTVDNAAMQNRRCYVTCWHWIWRHTFIPAALYLELHVRVGDKQKHRGIQDSKWSSCRWAYDGWGVNAHSCSCMLWHVISSQQGQGLG